MGHLVVEEISKYIDWFLLGLFIMGSIGNICLFIVYSSKTLRKLSIAIYFRIISIINVLIAIFAANMFIEGKFNIYIFNESKLLCKVLYNLEYILGPISSWLQVIVSFDRLLSIVFLSKISTLNKLNFQISIISTIFLANISFYLFTLFDTDLINNVILNNSSDMMNISTIQCSLVHYNDLLNWMDLSNVFASFVAMSFASAVTIVFIFRSRSRLNLNSSCRSKRDVKFAITSILLNLFYLLTNAPYSLYYSIFYRLSASSSTSAYTNINSGSGKFMNLITSLLWYFYYCFNFYLQLIVNSLVRREFLKMLAIIRESEFSFTNNNR